MKKEHLLFFLAVLATMISIGIAFILENIYAGFYSILVFSAIFLVALDRLLIKDLNPRNRKSVRVIIILFAVVSFGSAYHNLQRAYFQEEVLVSVRQYIDDGLTKVEIHNVMLNTLREYEFTDNDKEQSIKETFISLYGDRIREDGSLKPVEIGYDEEIDKFFTFNVMFPDDNTVQIRAISGIGQGEDPTFQNKNGKVGKMQSLATLTPNGVSYEREN